MSTSPLRTVVVDDVEGLRRLVTMILEGSDRYEVAGDAGSGEELLALLEDAAPDLILLDLSMPGMDGLEVLSRVKQATPDVDVVVLSGHEEAEMEREALERGAIGYVEKGLTPETLLEDLDRILDDAGR